MTSDSPAGPTNPSSRAAPCDGCLNALAFLWLRLPKAVSDSVKDSVRSLLDVPDDLAERLSYVFVSDPGFRAQLPRRVRENLDYYQFDAPPEATAHVHGGIRFPPLAGRCPAHG